MGSAGAARPRGGVDYPRTYQEFRDWFSDDRACLEYLGRLRWPDGFVCPRCGGRDSWRTAARLWMCAGCGVKTSATAGTIFHRSHSPVSTWFAAVWLVTSQKNGLSAQGLQRVLGFGSDETAWAWLHKLRRAMVRPDRERLCGIVEVDESFIGGQTPGRKGGSTLKVPVMIAVERTGKRALGRVRLAVAEAPNTNELVEFACQVVEPGSTIRTDGARVFRKLATMGYAHDYVTVYNSADPAHELLPGVHIVSSLLKRWIAGTHHQRVSDKHLPYYLDEYTFRFNRRKSRARGLLFYRLLQQALATDPHPLTELINGPKP
jgi:transposase-like protein